jgi:hypothetical protein
MTLPVGTIVRPGDDFGGGPFQGLLVKGQLHAQPFRIVREATRAEWLAQGGREGFLMKATHYYEVETD